MNIKLEPYSTKQPDEAVCMEYSLKDSHILNYHSNIRKGVVSFKLHL